MITCAGSHSRWRQPYHIELTQRRGIGVQRAPTGIIRKLGIRRAESVIIEALKHHIVHSRLDIIITYRTSHAAAVGNTAWNRHGNMRAIETNGYRSGGCQREGDVTAIFTTFHAGYCRARTIKRLIAPIDIPRAVFSYLELISSC